jgi:hypothetical protein
MRLPLNETGYDGFSDIRRCSLNEAEQALREALPELLEPVIDSRQRWNDAFANVIVVIPDD